METSESKPPGRASPAATPSHYTGEAGRRYHDGKRGLPPGTYDWMARLRAEKLQPHVQPTDVVFELGVGSGWNLAALTCARKIGSDVAEFLAAEVRGHGIEFLPDSTGIPASTMDVIVCHHVLEHMPDPVGTLDELRRILRPGGRLLLFVPYERERRHRNFDPAEPNHHLFSWTPQTLGNLVTDAGFDVRQVGLRTFRFDRFAAIFAHRFRLGETGYRLARRAGLLVAPEFEIELIATLKKT